MEFFVNLQMSCINATITDYFVMLFGDMADQASNEFHNRKCFFHIFVIFMPVVMESEKVTIIFINLGSGGHGSSEITLGIFYHGFGITFVWFCIDIEPFLVFPVTACFHLFERVTSFGFHFIQKGGTESIAEEGVVKVADITPETVAAVAAFRNEAVDMRVPFQVSAKGVEYHDKAECEVHGFILLKKHAGDNTVYGMEQIAKEGAVI